MSDEVTPPEMIAAGPRWRVAFAVGFLDGENGQPRAIRALAYAAGWKVGQLFGRLREKRRVI